MAGQGQTTVPTDRVDGEDSGSTSAATSASVHKQRVLEALSRQRRELGLPLSIFNKVRSAVNDVFQGQGETEARNIAEELLGERVGLFAATLRPGDFVPPFGQFTQARLNETLTTLTGLIQSAVDVADSAQLAEMEKNRDQRRKEIDKRFEDVWELTVISPARAMAVSGSISEQTYAEELLEGIRDKDLFEVYKAKFRSWFNDQESSLATGALSRSNTSLDISGAGTFLDSQVGQINLDAFGGELGVLLSAQSRVIGDAHANWVTAKTILQQQEDSTDVFHELYDGLQGLISTQLGNIGLDPTKRSILAHIEAAFQRSEQKLLKGFVALGPGADVNVYLQSKRGQLIDMPLMGQAVLPEFTGDLLLDLNAALNFVPLQTQAEGLIPSQGESFDDFALDLVASLPPDDAQELAGQLPALRADFLALENGAVLDPEDFFSERTGFVDLVTSEANQARREQNLRGQLAGETARLRQAAADPNTPASSQERLARIAEGIEQNLDAFIERFRTEGEGMTVREFLNRVGGELLTDQPTQAGVAARPTTDGTQVSSPVPTTQFGGFTAAVDRLTIVTKDEQNLANLNEAISLGTFFITPKTSAESLDPNSLTNRLGSVRLNDAIQFARSTGGQEASDSLLRRINASNLSLSSPETPLDLRTEQEKQLTDAQSAALARGQVANQQRREKPFPTRSVSVTRFR